MTVVVRLGRGEDSLDEETPRLDVETWVRGTDRDCTRSEDRWVRVKVLRPWSGRQTERESERGFRRFRVTVGFTRVVGTPGTTSEVIGPES